MNAIKGYSGNYNHLYDNKTNFISFFYLILSVVYISKKLKAAQIFQCISVRTNFTADMWNLKYMVIFCQFQNIPNLFLISTINNVIVNFK